ncbi:unnamed protein product [Closterium sp. Naga37s-1]|nr:unnamed protein product [Closterium sp. Naga37s-1]
MEAMPADEAAPDTGPDEPPVTAKPTAPSQPEKASDAPRSGLDFLRATAAPVTPEPPRSTVHDSAPVVTPTPTASPIPVPFTLPPAVAGCSKDPPPPSPSPTPSTVRVSLGPPSATSAPKRARSGKWAQSTLLVGGRRIPPPEKPDEPAQKEAELPEEGDIPVRADTGSPALTKTQLREQMYLEASINYETKWAGYFSWLVFGKTKDGFPYVKCSICMSYGKGNTRYAMQGDDGGRDLQTQSFRAHEHTDAHMAAVDRQMKIAAGIREGQQVISDFINSDVEGRRAIRLMRSTQFLCQCDAPISMFPKLMRHLAEQDTPDIPRQSYGVYLAREALAVKDAADSNPDLGMVDKVVRTVATLLGNSIVWSQRFKYLQRVIYKTNLEVQGIHTVRWLSRGDAVARLCKVLGACIVLLWEHNHKAYEIVTCYKFQFCLFFLADILADMNDLNRCFQRREDAADSNPDLGMVDKVVRTVATLLGNSIVWSQRFKYLQRVIYKTNLEVQGIHTVRWLSRGDAVARLCKVLGACIVLLWEHNHKAYEIVTCYKFQFCLFFLADILADMNDLNRCFQRREDAADSNPDLGMVDKVVRTVATLLGNSIVWSQRFKYLQRVIYKTNLEVQGIHTVRWLSRGDAVARLCKVLGACIVLLWEHNHKAYEIVTCYKFQFCLFFLADILADMNDLNRCFQRREDAADSNPDLGMVDKVVRTVATLLGNSIVWSQRFKYLQRVIYKTNLEVQGIHTVRWLSRGDAVARLCKVLGACIVLLWEHNHKAYEIVTCYKFQFCLFFLADILADMNDLNRCFQRRELDVTVIAKTIESTTSDLTERYLTPEKAFGGEGKSWLVNFLKVHKEGGGKQVRVRGVDGAGRPINHLYTMHERKLKGHKHGSTYADCVKLCRKFARDCVDNLNNRLDDLGKLGPTKLFQAGKWPKIKAQREKKCKEWLNGCSRLFRNKLLGFDLKAAERELPTFCAIMEAHHEMKSFTQGLSNFLGSADSKR